MVTGVLNACIYVWHLLSVRLHPTLDLFRHALCSVVNKLDPVSWFDQRAWVRDVVTAAAAAASFCIRRGAEIVTWCSNTLGNNTMKSARFWLFTAARWFGVVTVTRLATYFLQRSFPTACS
jgi:hypothetical protein